MHQELWHRAQENPTSNHRFGADMQQMFLFETQLSLAAVAGLRELLAIGQREREKALAEAQFAWESDNGGEARYYERIARDLFEATEVLEQLLQKVGA